MKYLCKETELICGTKLAFEIWLLLLRSPALSPIALRIPSCLAPVLALYTSRIRLLLQGGLLGRAACLLLP